MSPAGLFVIGVLVTVIVAAALVLLIYAAILDGRYEAAQKSIYEQQVVSEADRGRTMAHDQTTMIEGAGMQKNIVETARAAGTFTTLIAAIDRAGLRATLAGEGPFTVFAPSDEAFRQLPEGTVDSLLAEPAQLAKVLTYHVVPGRMTAADAAGLSRAPTVQGEDLPLSVDGGVHVEGARVLSADIKASNGLIHVIDRVLLPAAI
jgi:uncharacterized surface protein with fasciclin (FAS1) repeats